MNTVHNFLHRYCEERNLPPPSRTDLESCGKLISYHFKHYWTPQFPLEDGMIIENAGYTVQSLDDKKIIVQFYPDSFKIEMAHRIDHFYHLKNKRILESEKPSTKPLEPPVISPDKQRHRKRISSTERKPVFSTNHIK